MGLNIHYSSNTNLNWTREYLFKVLTEGRSAVLKNPQLINAFLRIDRRDFVPQNLAYMSYNDVVIDIANNIQLQKPTTIASFLELLSPDFGKKYLFLGSGCGFEIALISFIAGEKGKVIVCEPNITNINLVNSNLKKYALKNISFTSKFSEISALKFDGIVVLDDFKVDIESTKEMLTVNGTLIASNEEGNVVQIERRDTQNFEEEIINYISVARL